MSHDAKANSMLSLLHAIHYSYIDPGMDNGTKMLSKAFIRLQEIIRPEASLEIGAHDADFSVKLKKSCPEVNVIAYEGSKTVYDEMARKIDFDNLGISYRYGVVSDTDGTAIFREMVDAKTGAPITSYVSSLLPRRDMTFLIENKYAEKEVSAPSIRGDSLLFGYGDAANICVWIDAEGANREILHGLEGALGSGKIGSLFIEVEQNALWQTQWMDRDVYEYIAGFGYFLLARDCQHHAQYNMLFVRNDLLNNQLFGIVSQEYAASNRLSELHIRGSDFRTALSISRGESFLIGENLYQLSKSPDPRVLDLYSTSLPAECSYSVVFTGMYSIDIRLSILLPGIAFEDSALQVFDNAHILAEVRNKLLERCHLPMNSYEIRIGQKTEHGFLALSLPYTSLKFDYYLNVLIDFIDVTFGFLNQ